MLSDPTILDLLLLADLRPISNADVRRVLGLKAKPSGWRWLVKLTSLNMLEKRGNTYRTSTYGRGLVTSFSSVFHGAIKGKWSLPDTDKETSEKVVRYLREGTEFLHERGKIDSTEYQERLGFIDKLSPTLSS